MKGTTTSAQAPRFRTVADVAELGALVGYTSGSTVATLGPPARWHLNDTLAISGTPDPRLYVAVATADPEIPGDRGYWVRDIEAGQPGSCSEPAWYVNSSTGDDSVPHVADDAPLASIQEVLYRIGKQTIDGADPTLVAVNGAGIVYVYLVGDFAEALTIDLRFGNDGAIAFIGTKTNVLAAQTVSAVTAWNSTTGVIGSYTLSGAPDLSTHVGHFIRINAGARLGNKAPIAKAISAGVFRASWADQTDGSAIEPVVNDTADIYSVNAIAADIRISCGPSGTNGGTVYFQDLALGTPGQDHSVVVASGQATFTACVLHGLDFYEGVSLGTLALCYVVECRSYGYVDCQASTFASIGGTNLSARGRGIVRVSTRCLIQGGGATAGHATEGPGHLRIAAPLACADYAVPGLMVFPGSTATLDEVVTLRDDASAALGVQVSAGGGVYYATGKAPVIVGTTPTGDYQIGGTAKAKAELPYFEAANGAAVVVNQ